MARGMAPAGVAAKIVVCVASVASQELVESMKICPLA